MYEGVSKVELRLWFEQRTTAWLRNHHKQRNFIVIWLVSVLVLAILVGTAVWQDLGWFSVITTSADGLLASSSRKLLVNVITFTLLFFPVVFVAHWGFQMLQSCLPCPLDRSEFIPVWQYQTLLRAAFQKVALGFLCCLLPPLLAGSLGIALFQGLEGAYRSATVVFMVLGIAAINSALMGWLLALMAMWLPRIRMPGFWAVVVAVIAFQLTTELLLEKIPAVSVVSGAPPVELDNLHILLSIGLLIFFSLKVPPQYRDHLTFGRGTTSE